MDTMIWLAEQKVHYSSLMLHRNMNSDNEKKKASSGETNQGKVSNTFYQKV